MVKSYFALMLSATYWRYRRQKESHGLSIFWVAMVFGLLVMMWVMMLVGILFHKASFLQSYRTAASHIQLPLVFIFWVAGLWLTRKFIAESPSIYTEELTPEGYRAGNIYAVFFIAFNLGVFGYTLINLGNM